MNINKVFALFTLLCISVSCEEKVDTKGAMKQAIMSNPEVMKAFKLAKKMKATKAAS